MMIEVIYEDNLSGILQNLLMLIPNTDCNINVDAMMARHEHIPARIINLDCCIALPQALRHVKQRCSDENLQ